MKIKLLLLSISLFIVSLSFGQFFPGKNVDVLLGKTLKAKPIVENLQRFHYKNFFVSFDKTKGKFDDSNENNRLLPVGKMSTAVTDYNKVVGKEFKVIKIHEITPLMPSYKGRYFALEMESSEFGKVYYNYDTRYEHSFELDAADKSEIPTDFYCNQIEKSVDKFDGKTRWLSPVAEGLSLTRVKTETEDIIFLSIRVRGSTVNVGEKGAIILFEDGTKINKPETEIDVDAKSNAFMYSAFISLSDSEIQSIQDKTITDVRLYIYDKEVSSDASTKIKEYASCLVK